MNYSIIKDGSKFRVDYKGMRMAFLDTYEKALNWLEANAIKETNE